MEAKKEPRKPEASATLNKAIRVLGVLAGTRIALRFAEIQRATDLPNAVVHRLLNTFVAAGFVRYQPDDRRYRLGMRLFELAHNAWENFDIRGTAASELVKLGDKTGEAVGIAMLDRTDIVYIDEVAGSHPIQSRMLLGRRDPVYCTAIGKAILSVLDFREQSHIIDQLSLDTFTVKTKTDREAISKELYLIGIRGYAIEQDEHIDGISGVAAAILDYRGQPIGAIGLIGPSVRLGIERLHEHGPAIIEASWRVSMNAGGKIKRVSTVPKPAVAMEPEVDCVVREQAFIGESPTWCGESGRLYWADPAAPALHVSCPETGEDTVIEMDEVLSTLCLAGSGRLLLGLRSGLVLFDVERRSVVKRLGDPEPERPSNRFSGGRCDPSGRFWTGTTNLHGIKVRGALFRISKDGFFRMESGLLQPNGLGWSPDSKTMYLVDAMNWTIFAYAFDTRTGELSEKREFATYPSDRPDMPAGLVVDAEGGIWCAVWDGWCLHRYLPDGTLDRTVILPVPRPTSCIFGGPDLQTLYVTTSRIRVANEVLATAPLSGSILAVRSDVTGLPVSTFDQGV
ncbi:MAG: SMP-30/gluconolactonase/LRE family protein [Alphaproteobacteria bacterium]